MGKFANPEDELVDAYKKSFPGVYTGIVTNAQILETEKKADPEGFSKAYKLAADGQQHDAWAEQNPGLAAIEKAGAAFGPFNEAVGRVSSLLDKSYQDIPELKQAVDNSLAGKLFATSKNLEQGLGALKNSNDIAIVDAKTRQRDRTALTLANTAIDSLQALNPIPQSLGQAVVGGVLMAVPELPGKIGELLTKPENVEGVLRGFPAPGASKPFEQAADVERAKASDKFYAEQDKSTEATMREKNDWAVASIQNLTGSEDLVPQRPRQEVGKEIQSQLDPRLFGPDGKPVMNKLGTPQLDLSKKIGADKAPLVNNAQAIQHKLASLEPIQIPDVASELGGLRNELGSYLKKGQDAQAAAILEPYVRFGDFQIEQGVAGSPTVSNYPTASPLKMFNDVSTLREIAHNLTSEFQGSSGKTALLKAADIIESGLNDNIPNELSSSISKNKAGWADFYKTHYDPRLNDLRGNYNSPTDASMVPDMAFKNEDWVDKLKGSLSPEAYDSLRIDRARRIHAQLLDSADPAKALSKMEQDAPGYLKSVFGEQGLQDLKSFAGNKSDVVIIKEDLASITDKRTEQSGRRSNDPADMLYQRRSEDNLTKYQKVTLAGGGLVGGVGMLAFHSWPVAAFGAMMGAYGIIPEALSKLYVSNPEIRVKLVELSQSANNFEQARNSASLIAAMMKIKKEKEEEQKKKKEGKPTQWKDGDVFHNGSSLYGQ